MTANRKLKPVRPAAPVTPLHLRLRTALGLGAAVLLAHLALLAGLELPQEAPALAATPQAFSTRRIEPPPLQAPAARPRPQPEAPALTPTAAASPAPPPVSEAAHAQAHEKSHEQAAGPAHAPAPSAAPPVASAEPAPAEPQAPSHALQLPAPARLRYELSGQARGFAYSADAQLFWKHDGQRYDARMVVSSLLFTRSMSSVGELGPQGLSPRRFSDKGRSEQATHFEPEQGRIVFSANAPQAVWQPGVQDRLSLFFQLAGLLAGEPGRYPPGTQLQVPTAGTREADVSVFTVLPPATLALPLGEQATVALRREPRRRYDQAIELWFAPALGYLPVRIRITQPNGDVLDQRLAAVDPP